MGCVWTKKGEQKTAGEERTNKIYSWDKKRKLGSEPRSFIIEDLENHEEIKIPGSVNGEQFIIQNCKNSLIYIFDYINTIIIDDCINCTIVLGPVEGSAFIRNCKLCTCVLACGQFRMRDSVKINVFLFCATQPIIEASSGINFGNYHLQYNDIQTHFEKANLYFNKIDWKIIYDYTPIEFEQNWNFIHTYKITDYILQPKLSATKNKLEELGHVWLQSEGERAYAV